jgi:hypothetical protein
VCEQFQQRTGERLSATSRNHRSVCRQLTRKLCVLTALFHPPTHMVKYRPERCPKRVTPLEVMELMPEHGFDFAEGELTNESGRHQDAGSQQTIAESRCLSSIHDIQPVEELKSPCNGFHGRRHDTTAQSAQMLERPARAGDLHYPAN